MVDDFVESPEDPEPESVESEDFELLLVDGFFDPWSFL